MMLSKSKQKLIHSLEHKKYRQQEQLFVAEGPKLVRDLLSAFPCRLLLTSQGGVWEADEVLEVTPEELRRASLQQHPQGVLALFEMPQLTCAPSARGQLVLALDGVQDPGNVGTILRIADWFGIREVVCSPQTADVFSPKVVQATMGALARVRCTVVDLPAWLSEQEVPIYGTLLDGENLYGKTLSQEGVIVMGNEGKGLTEEVRERVTERLLIPSFPADAPTSESLNVAVATAIVCAEFRRGA